ncbi:hypothetical protein FRC00_008778 [Tulasnella sp. 408]|nr:hypothetical protein FRC00_008778 [Tulasnella sp. 408]
MDDGTVAVAPAETKPVTNTASPEPKISTASSPRQASLPTGTDITQFSGRAAEWKETMTIKPSASQPPVPPLPGARSRRASAATQPDETPRSHRHPSAPTDPGKKAPLKLDDLKDFSASGSRSARLKAWDRTGQLTERTKPKFTGGFSDVSQAKLGNRVVAVKTLRANMEAAEGRIWKRLAREIYVWTALDHPNVLELLGFAIEDGKPCLISPWCDNGTLQEYLQKFPDANRRRLVREIAEGLRYLHERTPPILHGDLKTTNVFVTGDHEAKISDFGGSRRVEELRTGLTTAGLVLTTIRYSAPEILRDGQQPTLASDVFSFASVALETMTDKCPFYKIPNVVGVITQVVFQRQTPSPDDHPGVEEAMWVLLRKCWSYEPSDRPKMMDVCRMVHFPPQPI